MPLLACLLNVYIGWLFDLVVCSSCWLRFLFGNFCYFERGVSGILLLLCWCFLVSCCVNSVVVGVAFI